MLSPTTTEAWMRDITQVRNVETPRLRLEKKSRVAARLMLFNDSSIIFPFILAFCRDPKLEKWYKFDDHMVSTMDGAEVRSSAAYILFYTNQEEKRRRF